MPLCTNTSYVGATFIPGKSLVRDAMTELLNVPILTTTRLRLEPLSEKHSFGMYNLWSDPDVCRYSGVLRNYERNPIETPVSTQTASDQIVDFWLRAAEDGWGFRWAVIATEVDEFTGTVGFNSLGDRSEIAYHLLPKHWGKGVMTEASKAAIEWRRDNGALEIEAFIAPENSPSIALAVRLGMSATDEFAEGAQRHRMTV